MQGAGDKKGVDSITLVKGTDPGREALEQLLGPLFKDFWTDVLNMAFEWFPHEPGDGSQNARTFQAIRHRVLREGNNAKRAMSDTLKAFAIQQLFDRSVERQVIKGQGPFNLPPGVRMPQDRIPSKA